MSTLEIAVTEFMVDHSGFYNNEVGVQLCMCPKGMFNISGKWPGYIEADDTSLHVGAEFESAKELIQFLSINSVEQLNSISPQTLLDKYQEGTAEVDCFIEGILWHSQLWFHKVKNEIWAKDESDREHKVTVNLKAPQDFIEYTRSLAVVDLANDN